MTKELDQFFDDASKTMREFNDYLSKFFYTSDTKAEKVFTREEWKKIKKMEWGKDQLWKKFVKVWEETNL